MNKICKICGKSNFAKLLCKNHYEVKRLRKVREKRKKEKLKLYTKIFSRKPDPKTKEAMWLQGFADGEGSVSKSKTKSGGYSTRMITISNTEPLLITKASEYLSILNIGHSIVTRAMVNKKPIQIIRISHQENLVKWRNKIGFISPKKLQRLEEMIKDYESARLVWNEKKVNKIMAMKLSGYSYQDIANKVRCSEYSIWRVLHDKKYKTKRLSS